MTTIPIQPTPAADRLDRITTRARAIRPGRTLLTVLAAVLWCAGWVVARVLGAVWLAAVWCGAAVQVGWEDAREASRPAANPDRQGT